MLALLEAICVDDVLPEFNKVQIYDTISLINKEKPWNICSGWKEFEESMFFLTPTERELYMVDLKFVSESSQVQTFYTLKILEERYKLAITKLQNILCPRVVELMRMNVIQYMKTQVIKSDDADNTKLRYLTGTRGNYGSVHAVNAFTALATVSHFIDGGFYPTDGPDSITHALIMSIEKSFYQSEIVAQHSVTNVTRKGSLYSVQTNNGLVFKGRKVISSAGLEATNRFYPTLLHDKTKQLLNTRVPNNMQFAFIELKTHVNLTPTNLWCELSTDFTDYQLFVSCSTAKENDNTSDVQCVTLLTTRQEQFSINEIEKLIQTHFNSCEILRISRGGEEQMQKYLGRKKPYGLVNNWNKTQIPISYNHNTFFLTGQDTLGPGIAGAMSSAVVTAHCVLPLVSMLDLTFSLD